MPKPARQFAAPPLEPDDLPDTFKVTGWKVFAPGYHKGRLYPASDCKQTVANFSRLSTGDDPWLKPKAKLGHDSEQRIAKSLGLPNCGVITGCRETDDGGFEIDINRIPHKALTESGELFDVKGAFDAGLINDGSIELVFDVPDPDDPSKTIPGPVLEGIAFLGEEQPAIKGNPTPKATFSARHRPEPEPEFCVLHGRRYPVRRIHFSEVETMPTRDEILQQLAAANIDVGSDPTLAGLDDAALYALLKQVTGDGYCAKMKEKFTPATTPVTTPATTPAPVTKPADTDLSAKFAKFADDQTAFQTAVTQRMGAMESAIGDVQKLKPELQAAAKFSQSYEQIQKDQKTKIVTDAVEKAVDELRIQPVDKADFIAIGLAKNAATVFAAGTANAGQTELQVWLASLETRPRSRFSREEISDAIGDGDETITAADRRTMERTPKGRAALARHDAAARGNSAK
jgi:hypothetical protein